MHQRRIMTAGWTPVHFSVFSVVDEEPSLRAGRGGDRLEEAIQLAKEADRDRFHTFWVAEHHFHQGGVLPAPPVWLAAAARETSRLRLGVMVAVLPLHAPRELAEQYALVDRLSGGRLEIGMGGGYIPQELQGFGIPPTERRQRFDTALPEFVAALSGEPLPVPGEPGVTVRLNVTPVQRPHPPLWMAVQRREALPFVARRGMSIALIPYATVHGLDELERNIREYRSALPKGAERTRVAAAFHVFVGNDPEEGREALQRYLDSRVASGSPHFEARLAEDPEGASVEGLEKRGLVMIGDSREAREWVRRVEATGVTDLLGIFDFGGLPVDAACRSMRRFSQALGLSGRRRGPGKRPG